MAIGHLTNQAAQIRARSCNLLDALVSHSVYIGTARSFLQKNACLRLAAALNLSSNKIMEQITIKWEQGTEKINVDFSRLGEDHYEITETCHEITGNVVTYVTTSDIEPLEAGRFRVKIYYGKEVRLAAHQFNSPWGYITLDLYAGITKGTAYWKDDQPSMLRGLPFKVETVFTQGNDLFAFLGNSEEGTAVTKIRRKQWLFRHNVQFWEQSCRVTGIDNPKFLIARHMKPWHAAEEREKTSGYNGLMLAPHIGHLFENYFISFTDSGDSLVSERLPEAVRASLLPAKRAEPRPFSAAQLPFLEVHRKKFMELNKAG